ncbi:hypothetical protein GCM10028856_18200 [Halopiger thermotolerans]
MSEEVPFAVEIHVAGEIDDDASGRDEILAVPREQVFQRCPPGFEERVRMRALGDSSAYNGLGGQSISFDDRDFAKSIS